MSFKKAALRPSASAATLTDSELQQVFAAAQADPSLQDLHDAMTIVSNTGIRTGELQQMRWSDVDLTVCQFRIASKASGVRTVHFETKTLLALEALRQRRPESELLLGDSPVGAHHRMSRQLHALSEQMGIRVTFQALRHTFFTRLLNAGVDFATLMSIAGWRSVRLFKFLTVSDDAVRRGYEAALKAS